MGCLGAPWGLGARAQRAHWIRRPWRPSFYRRRCSRLEQSVAACRDCIITTLSLLSSAAAWRHLCFLDCIRHNHLCLRVCDAVIDGQSFILTYLYLLINFDKDRIAWWVSFGQSSRLVYSVESAIFLPRSRCMQCRRGLAMRILSVRLSVKRVICDKREERSVQIFISYERSCI